MRDHCGVILRVIVKIAAVASQTARLGLVTFMKTLDSLKSRFPKLVPAAFALVVILGAGGHAAYAKFVDSCCYPGSPCCHPGAACCAAHKSKS